jgi:hypothetical protein
MLLLLCDGSFNVNLDWMYYALGGLQASGSLAFCFLFIQIPTFFTIVSRLIGFSLQ